MVLFLMPNFLSLMEQKVQQNYNQGNIDSEDIEIIGGEVHNTIPNYVTVKGFNIETYYQSYKNLF